MYILSPFVLFCLSWVAPQEAQTPSPAPAPAPAKLNLVIVEGEGAINNIKQRTSRETIVRVEDENHRPVAGAAVAFLLPDYGPSGAFVGGGKTAVAAAAEFQKLEFAGKQARELLGQRDLDYKEATSVIGKAIEKPNLAYMQLPPQQLKPALTQMGLSANMADLLLEMAEALQLRVHGGA